MLWKTICCLCFVLAFRSPDASAAIYPSMTGTVVDAATGKPIQGASVLVYWTKRVLRPPMEGGSELVAARMMETDRDGHYRIGGLLNILGLLEFKGETVLVVYQPGYRAHIEQEYNSGSKEITKNDNSIRLERIGANFDHGKHYDEIDRALWGLEYRSYASANGSLTWSAVKDHALIGLPEKQELLRRAYWEEERSRRKHER